jgi:hypothetical protein
MTTGVRARVLGALYSLVLAAMLGACSKETTNTVTVPAPDTTAPLVVYISPVSGAAGVALDSAVSASFSEAMNPATLTAATFTVNGVAGVVSVSGDSRSITFTPTSALAPNSSYIATVTTGARDVAGNGLAADVSWTFATGAAPDNTAPLVSGVTPLHGSEGNTASVGITATFSEAINCASVTTANVQLLEATTPVPIQVQCSGTTVTLLPVQGIPTNTILTASIGPTVTDLAGNVLANVHTWSFGMAPWTRQFGTAGSDVARALAADRAGDVYVAGYTNGALDGETSAGGYDLFVTKYDRAGARLWTRQLGTAGNDYAYALATDAAGNAVAAGYTNSALDGQTSAGGYDLFVTKYDPAGARLWTRQLGTAANDYAYALASDPGGNVYVAGATAGALDGQTSAGGYDLFVTKYDPAGARLWTRQLGTAGDEAALAVTADPLGNAYVAGTVGGALDGQLSAGSTDIFVVKYAANGTKQWTRQLGTAGRDDAYALTSDPFGNVYVAGNAGGALDGQTSAGDPDFFVTKYEATGAKQWTRQLGTAGADPLGGMTSWDQAYAITSDAAGNVYVAGYTQGALDGQSSAGGYDLFVTKYDTSGVRQWTRQLGTTGTEEAYAITSDAAGNVYVAGYTDGALDGQTQVGLGDVFVVKYQSDGRKR